MTRDGLQWPVRHHMWACVFKKDVKKKRNNRSELRKDSHEQPKDYKILNLLINFSKPRFVTFQAS